MPITVMLAYPCICQQELEAGVASTFVEQHHHVAAKQYQLKLTICDVNENKTKDDI
jgi:hypothetical protein